MKYITKYVENKNFSVTLINLIYQFKIDKSEILAHSMLARLLSNSNKEFNNESIFTKEKLKRYIIKYNSMAQSINNIYFMNFSLLIPSDNVVSEDFIEDAIKFMLESIYDPNTKDNLFDNNLFEKERRIYLETLLNGYNNATFIAEKNALDLIDTNGIINKLKYKDIEYVKNIENQDIIEFYNKYIKNTLPKIFINGNYNQERLENIFKNYLENKNLKPYKALSNYNYFYNNKFSETTDNTRFNQSIVYMTYKVNNYSENDLYKLYLINLLLSSEASDILLDVLRKQNNLVYTSGSTSLIRNGLLIIKAITNYESIKLVKLLIEDILNKLKDIKNYKNNINNVINRLKSDLEREKDDFYIISSNIINKYFKSDITSEEEYKIIKNIKEDEIIDLIDRLELMSIYTMEGNRG